MLRYQIPPTVCHLLPTTKPSRTAGNFFGLEHGRRSFSAFYCRRVILSTIILLRTLQVCYKRHKIMPHTFTQIAVYRKSRYIRYRIGIESKRYRKQIDPSLISTAWIFFALSMCTLATPYLCFWRTWLSFDFCRCI